MADLADAPAKMGRPSKYSDDLPEKMLKWFADKPLTVRVERAMITARGPVTGMVDEPGELPTLLDFAISIGVHVSTLWDWATERIKDEQGLPTEALVRPEFAEAYARAKNISESRLQQNALANRVSPDFAKFTGKNMFGWKDKTEVEQDVKSSDGSMSPVEPVDKTQLDDLLATLKEKTGEQA